MSYDGSWPPPADDPPPDRPPPDRSPYDRPSFGQPGFSQPPFVHLPPEPLSPGPGPYGDEWPGTRQDPDDRRWADDGPYGGGPSREPEHDRWGIAPADPLWPGRTLDRPHPRPRPGPDPDEPSGPRHGPGPRRGRVRLVAAGLVVAGAVAAVAIRQSGGGGTQPGSTGGGWEAEQFGDSQMLVSDGEQVCSATADSLVFCLDPETGDEVFSRQLYLSVVTSPTLADGGVLVGGSSSGSAGTIFAYSPEGDELWEAPLEITSDRPLLVVGDVVALASANGSDGALVGLDVATGAERWRVFDAAAGSTAQLVSTRVFTDGTRLYVAITEGAGSGGPGTGHIVAVDPASGQEIWRSPGMAGIGLGRSIASAAPFADGSAAAFTLEPSSVEGNAEGARLVVLDSATGTVRWEAPTATSASVAHLEGLTIAVDGPDMRAYDGTGGEVWTAEVPVSEEAPGEPAVRTLVLDGGRLFGIGRDVYAIDPVSGDSALVIASGTTSDVAVAGDSLVVAGVFAVAAVPLDEVPFGEQQVTVVTG